MRKLMTIISLRLVLGCYYIVFLGFVSTVQDTQAEDAQTLEGEWQVQSSWDTGEIGNRHIIIRQGDGYKVRGVGFACSNPNFPLYYGTPTQIMAIDTPSFNDLVCMFTSLSQTDLIAVRELADKVRQRYRITLSADGRSAERAVDHLRFSNDVRTGHLTKYDIVPFADRSTLVRISGPTTPETRADRAYQADCGVVDPNRTTPINRDLCPGNLVCMTYFCGGGMGCAYVCCPKGLPYLNHCDCKCYATSDFDCHSYSVGREQPKQ